MKKHSAPTNVPKFTRATFIGRPIVGATSDAITGAKSDRAQRVEGRDPARQAGESPTVNGVTHFKPRPPTCDEGARLAKCVPDTGQFDVLKLAEMLPVITLRLRGAV